MGRDKANLKQGTLYWRTGRGEGVGFWICFLSLENTFRTCSFALNLWFQPQLVLFFWRHCQDFIIQIIEWKREEERGEEDVLVKWEQSCFWSWSKAAFEIKGFIFWCFCKRELDVQFAFALSSFHFTERADESHWYLDLHFFFNAAHILYWGPIQLQRERKVVVKLDRETTLAKFTHSSPSCRGNLKIGGANKKTPPLPLKYLSLLLLSWNS